MESACFFGFKSGAPATSKLVIAKRHKTPYRAEYVLTDRGSKLLGYLTRNKVLAFTFSNWQLPDYESSF
jgi:hypothetical protein